MFSREYSLNPLQATKKPTSLVPPTVRFPALEFRHEQGAATLKEYRPREAIPGARQPSPIERNKRKVLCQKHTAAGGW
ncbi:hypothetical protein BaRGS_00030496 [Batillaria attramentaria]|uniref:Uncharacterized protein n=1 Tax=Batillaria attramentaria TaxID=370345 RepID=A0ABD0JT67_9CAEN